MNISQILRGDIDEKELPFLNNEAFSTLIVKTVKAAYKEDVKNIKQIISKIESTNLDETLNSVLAIIFCSLELKDKHIKYLYENGINFVDAAEKICNYDSIPSSSYAITRCLKIGKIDVSIAKELYQTALNSDNDKCANAISEYIGENNEFATMPNHCTEVDISSEELFNLLPLPKEKILTREELAFLLAGVKEGSEDYENNLREKYIYLSEMNDEEVIQIQRENFDLWNGAEDEEIFKILGPSNKFPSNRDIDYETGSDYNTYCAVYGGCRMLTCNHLETEDENFDMDTTDWFTGFCRECELKISSPAVAVRKKPAEGHFFGCYCSFNCIRKSKPYGTLAIYENDDEGCEIEPRKIIENQITNELELELKKVGIYVPNDSEYYTNVYEGNLED